MNKKLFEKIYTENSVYFHGDTNEVEKLILGNEKYAGKGLYITDSPSYVVAYSLVSVKGNFSKSREGTIYTIKLKKNLNLFDADSAEDLKKLQSYFEENTGCEFSDEELESLNYDWYFWSKRKPDRLVTDRTLYWDKTDLINWIRDLGFDGFKNNEDWRIRKARDDNAYHSVGSGIMIFDTSNLEIIKETDNVSFMKEHNLTIDDILMLDND